MKKLKATIYLLILISFSSCTQPDGYIGDWFGSWHLEEMYVNGELDTQYAEWQKEDTKQIMVSFQGNIFNMAYIGSDEIYGTWSFAGDTLSLIASYNAGSGTNSTLFNPYPTMLHFPPGLEEIKTQVNNLTSKKMQWQLIDQNGQLHTYNFRKYP